MFGKVFIGIFLFCDMTNLLEKLETDYLLGCIKYQDAYSLYAMPLGWWILNHSKYDPESAAQGGLGSFRNGIYNVGDSEIQNFIKAIESDKVTSESFKSVSHAPAESKKLSFFVDFDAKLFINGYYENVEPEEYLPDEAWRGENGFPISHLPNEFRGEFDGLW